MQMSSKIRSQEEACDIVDSIGTHPRELQAFLNGGAHLGSLCCPMDDNGIDHLGEDLERRPGPSCLPDRSGLDCANEEHHSLDFVLPVRDLTNRTEICC